MTAAWIRDFPSAITVCDAEGVIIAMNVKSALLFEKYGGWGLIGKSLLDCHPPEAKEKIAHILENQLDNCYMTEKEGIRKLIIQSPWYEGSKFMGLVEIVTEIAADIPVFQR